MSWRYCNILHHFEILCVSKKTLMGARNEILSLSSRLAGFLSSSLLSRIVRWCCAFRVEHDCKLRTGDLRGGHVFLTHGRQYFTTRFKLLVVQCWSDCIKMKSAEVLTSSVGCSFSFPHNLVGICYKLIGPIWDCFRCLPAQRQLRRTRSSWGTLWQPLWRRRASWAR